MKNFFISIAVCCLSLPALAEDIAEIYNAQCTYTDIFWGDEEHYSYLNIVFSSDRNQLKEVKIGNDGHYWRFLSLERFGEFPNLVDQFENAVRYRSPGPNPKGIKDFEANLEYIGTELSMFTSYNYGRSNEGGWHNRIERKVVCKVLSKK